MFFSASTIYRRIKSLLTGTINDDSLLKIADPVTGKEYKITGAALKAYIGAGGGGASLESYQNDAMSDAVDAYVYRDSDDNIIRVYEPLRNNDVRIKAYEDKFPFDNEDCYNNTINDVDFQNLASDVVIQGCTLETMVINANSHTGLQLLNTRIKGNYAVVAPNGAEIYLTGDDFQLSDCSFGQGSYFNSNGDLFGMSRSTGGARVFFNFNGATNVQVIDSTFGDSSYFEMIDGVRDSIVLYEVHLNNASGINVNGSDINITGCQLNAGAYLVTNGICEHSIFDTYTEVTVNNGSLDHCSFGVGVEMTVSDAKANAQFINLAGTVYELGVTTGAVTATAV